LTAGALSLCTIPVHDTRPINNCRLLRNECSVSLKTYRKRDDNNDYTVALSFQRSAKRHF